MKSNGKDAFIVQSAEDFCLCHPHCNVQTIFVLKTRIKATIPILW